MITIASKSRSTIETVETQKLNISINHFNRKIRSSTHACAKIVQFLTGKEKIIFRAKSCETILHNTRDNFEREQFLLLSCRIFFSSANVIKLASKIIKC